MGVWLPPSPSLLTLGGSPQEGGLGKAESVHYVQKPAWALRRWRHEDGRAGGWGGKGAGRALRRLL